MNEVVAHGVVTPNDCGSFDPEPLRGQVRFLLGPRQEWICSKAWAETALAPSNGTPGTQVSAACQAQLLGMLNTEHGTNLTDANVTGTYLNGTAGNLLINATGLTAGNSIRSSRVIYILRRPILARIRDGRPHCKEPE